MPWTKGAQEAWRRQGRLTTRAAWTAVLDRGFLGIDGGEFGREKCDALCRFGNPGPALRATLGRSRFESLLVTSPRWGAVKSGLRHSKQASKRQFVGADRLDDLWLLEPACFAGPRLIAGAVPPSSSTPLLHPTPSQGG